MRFALLVAAVNLPGGQALAAADASWLLAYRGKSTNAFFWDKRAAELIRHSLPGGLAENVRPALGGPPDPVFVAEDRYVSASACLPHACFDKAFLWVDTTTGATLGAYAEEHGWAPPGMSRYAITLGSVALTADAIPNQAVKALRAWIADHDLAPAAVEFVGRDGTRQLDASVYAPRAARQSPAGLCG